ncbi:TetR family transcriptional regulator [Nocardioides sp. GY 10113]|uniref:TetR family transcriptional regulator n=1 Tax=Nocardioides sp. GY 10113 TaxID=2569761 RepID=UPI0010A9299C|nr:TetR family transcriptional regulator [Nocardioides sp. GY 10113]TIC87720.1 TetR family transcriptional regulator [Nocardioides sp. GY 10113]
MTEELGRREAHKAATRRALQDAATRLFAAQGFNGTTVQQIADAAGVTERTFFRYFGSKDELLVDLILGGLPLLQAAIAARPAGEAPLAAVKGALIDTVSAVMDDERRPVLARLFEGGPPGVHLQQAGAHLLLRLEAAFAEALEQRLYGGSGAEISDAAAFRAEVLAAVAVAATRRALMRNGELIARGQGSRQDLVRLIESAFAALE